MVSGIGHETDIDLLRAALAFEQERLRLKDRGVLQAEHPAVAEGRCGPRLQQEHAMLQERAPHWKSRLASLSGVALPNVRVYGRVWALMPIPSPKRCASIRCCIPGAI